MNYLVTLLGRLVQRDSFNPVRDWRHMLATFAVLGALAVGLQWWNVQRILSGAFAPDVAITENQNHLGTLPALQPIQEMYEERAVLEQRYASSSARYTDPSQ